MSDTEELLDETPPEALRAFLARELATDPDLERRFHSFVNYPALLALTRSVRTGLARGFSEWDSPRRKTLVARGQTPAAI